LIFNEKLRRRLAAKALEEVETKYSWPVVVEQLEAVYHKISKEEIDTVCRSKYNMSNSLADADLSCRFRKDLRLLRFLVFSFFPKKVVGCRSE